MADLTYIRVEHDAEIAVVSIDRQDKLNVLNAEVVAELGQVFESLRKDDSVRGVIVTGAGEKAFVAGADIGELAKMDAISGVRVSRDGQDVFMVIERFPKPVLAAVGGFALGGGGGAANSPWRATSASRARTPASVNPKLVSVSFQATEGRSGYLASWVLAGRSNSRSPERWSAPNAPSRLD